MSSRVDPRTPPKPGKVAWQIPAFAVAVVLALYGTREVAGYIETGKWTAGLPHILVRDMISGIARGKYKWSGVHTYVAVGFGLLVALSAVLLVVHIGRRPRRSKTRDAARHLGKAESMSLKAVSARSDSSRLTTGPIKGMMICETMGKKNRYVDFRSTGVAIMGTGAGKALSLDTQVPTPMGWTNMGALRVGDAVFDEHGAPTVVVQANDVMYDHTCYEVHFSTGEVVVADAEHLWTTTTAADKKHVRRVARQVPYGGKHRGRPVHVADKTVTTQEIADTLVSSERKKHSIKVCGPVQYPKQDLPVAPYTLGAWLGDGTSASSQITNHPSDAQILDEIRADGYVVRNNQHPNTHHIGKSTQLQVQRSLVRELRELTVLDNKHIPNLYLTTSVGQRLALLQGLMDTDGTVDKAGRLTFAVTNERLAHNTLELILSLGIRTRIRVGVAKLNGRVIGPQYKIHFRTDLPVFRLARKVVRTKLSTCRVTARYITAVRSTASVPVRCIKVANPSGLFLVTKSFIATHNTTGLSIPMIMDAPGVAFATTNKRDLPDAIRGAKDGKVWVFDPQQLTGTGMPAWRLELSNYVTDEVRAHKLAKIWVDASSPQGAKKDAYFSTAGPNLLAGLLQAAALDNRPISQVYKWLAKPTNQESVQILRREGFDLPAMALEGVYNAPEEQMGGVFGTASETVSFLNNTRVRSWLEPDGPGDMRPVFSPEDFVRSGNQTMLALSKEGIESTGPLTASLTMWVLDAAEEMADLHAHGRLSIPLTVILDEAANVTPILSLPNLYSHYGSRGIFLFTILQSWAQGVQVWGENGMQAMWDAATFCMVGKGQKNIKFLEMISKLLDDKYVPEHSTSPGRNKSLLGGGGRSTSYRLQPIMTVGDLGSMKVFETVVLPSEDKPFVGMLLPWMQRKDLVERVSASIAKYEPQNSVAAA